MMIRRVFILRFPLLRYIVITIRALVIRIRIIVRSYVIRLLLFSSEYCSHDY